MSVFAPELASALGRRDEGVTGLAAGPDGSLYVASPSRIWNVNVKGGVGYFMGEVKDCDEYLPPNWKAPGK